VLVIVASTTNEAEAEAIGSRLNAAGIGAVVKRGGGADLPQLGASGSRDVYVEDLHVERARALLETQEFTDDELEALSMQAYEDIKRARKNAE
jgi:hypothetical protein